MTNFSQRMGISPLKKHLQTESLDQETRNLIWNGLQVLIIASWKDQGFGRDRETLKGFYEQIWMFYFKYPIDDLSSFDDLNPNSPYALIKDEILEGEWHKALDLVEYIIKTGPDESIKELIQYLNWSFKKENVGYRVIGKEITPITTPIEIDSINKALQTPYQSITTHFDTALSLLSSKTNPDYRNSIKESISAVERSEERRVGKESIYHMKKK